MKIGDPVVVIQNILPDSHGMAFFTVKSPVHKFNLGHLIFQKKIQFLFYQLQVPEPHRLVNRGQAVAAGKRAASAALIIEDSVFKLLQILIDKRNLI